MVLQVYAVLAACVSKIDESGSLKKSPHISFVVRVIGSPFSFLAIKSNRIFLFSTDIGSHVLSVYPTHLTLTSSLLGFDLLLFGSEQHIGVSAVFVLKSIKCRQCIDRFLFNRHFEVVFQGFDLLLFGRAQHICLSANFCMGVGIEGLRLQNMKETQHW